MKNKLYNAIALTVFLVCVLFLARGCVQASFRDVEFGKSVDTPTNYTQLFSSMELSASDGQLYIRPQKESRLWYTYGDHYYTLSKGKLLPVTQKDKAGDEFAVKDGVLYFDHYDSVREKTCIYGYDLATGKVHFLTDGNFVLQNEQGDVFVRKYEDESPVYYPIDGIRLGEPMLSVEPSYVWDGYTYTVEGNNAVCYTPGGERVDLGERNIPVPCENGILLVGQFISEKIYLIHEPGTNPALIGDFSGFWEGGIALYGNQLYFSSPFPWESSKNKPGTYCIDLDTLSCKKISDQGYVGLYIFDDTGLFACDPNGSIVKMDWNGNVVQTLLKVVSPWDISILLPIIGILSVTIWIFFRLRHWLKYDPKSNRAEYTPE